MPSIARILKLRRKQISAGNDSILTKEYKNVIHVTSGILEILAKDSINFLNNARNFSLSWLNISLKEANEKTLLELNKNYLKSFGSL